MTAKIVRAKKHLGQHFLNDEGIAQQIVAALQCNVKFTNVLEIGAGMGVLTKYILKLDAKFYLVEIDHESVAYLESNYPQLSNKIISKDFLKLNLTQIISAPVAIIGNFPYNISTEILFKVLENKDLVPLVVGMFQKEVAMRVTSAPGNKAYGIVSVLIQAYYNVEYLFTVDAQVFTPPPKVQSGVIRLTRNDVIALPCNEMLFSKVVKTAFNQRRKTLRNALKSFNKTGLPFMDKRAEQLSCS
ncbi:MAG TPA: 16S rRNA (adenine(1518)-N(6)/adenine(1519)-N(6))-dimethyltransferase RsmA, partial [Bacteroidia bacterium]|nr:16S rRNA (adenine(1518)-N(6)/adenine(1519)-N(6))-dimethyltransferase RsmA [Bacteroidia bacterium]